MKTISLTDDELKTMFDAIEMMGDTYYDMMHDNVLALVMNASQNGITHDFAVQRILNIANEHATIAALRERVLAMID